MTSHLTTITLFASTARGLEELLKSELEQLGATGCRIAQGGVHFDADTTVMYQALLWSRFASRIFLPISEFNVYSDLDLYLGVNAVKWDEIFSVESTFAVQFVGTNQEIRNSQYGALKVKDAIVDYFQRKMDRRPDVEKGQPDIRVNLFLNKEKATLSLDLSGESLHLRGYRDVAGVAPLKENLAAAIVQRSGWQPETPMLDPMCGSGTILIEAAMMAADMAPRLQRRVWGFNAWHIHDEALWQSVVSQAHARAKQGLVQTQSRFVGYDIDAKMVEIAKHNASRAGVSSLITFSTQEIGALTNPFAADERGTVVSNPPYGERLDSEPALIALYSTFGRLMKRYFPGWGLSVFSSSENLLSCIQMRADKQFKAKNGPLDCLQKNYRISERRADENTEDSEFGAKVSEHATDFINRLRKNAKKYDKWAKKEGVDCYRLYDADLPEYNVAIDRYADKVVVQEYAPPKTVDATKAKQRLFDIINATIAVLAIPTNSLVLKTRERQKGKQQYEKLAEKREFFLVQEYNARLWVNLTDYLDTGLFLDHRIARKTLGEMCQGQDFLNLFAYTGSATVHAGLGGARTTTSVDMSRTYLEWAENNLRVNGLTGDAHQLLQADCIQWLTRAKGQYGVIFIDPPTFSNSKRMDETFDVQRDYLFLLKHLKRLLRPQGVIMFSNNKRGFKMDLSEVEQLGLTAQDITDKTRSPDFARNRQIHNCWLLRHKK